MCVCVWGGGHRGGGVIGGSRVVNKDLANITFPKHFKMVILRFLYNIIENMFVK